ncbi:MAG: 50S ribosomal protein L4 [Candidatus Tyrphobacter sp.]
MPGVIDGTGAHVRDVDVPDLFAKAPASSHALFRAVHREFANARAGTASTRKRDEVAGGGKKPWRQKGTGRARHGSIRSPQWRHGGVVFGPQPRSYAENLNKKERRVALVAALAERFSSDAVTLLDDATFLPTKTSECIALVYGSRKGCKGAPTTLVVHARGEENAAAIARASRNLPKIAVTDDGALDVKDILRYGRIVLTVRAYEAIVQRLMRSA